MISNDISTTETVRNVYVIDDRGIVRAILVYPMQVGRCIPEILRLLDALQTVDRSKAMTAANWMPGNPVIMPKPNTFEELLKRKEEICENRNGMSWYLGFKQPQLREKDCKCNRCIEDNEEKKMLNTKKENAKPIR